MSEELQNELTMVEGSLDANGFPAFAATVREGRLRLSRLEAVAEAAREMAVTLDRVLDMTGQQLTVTVEGHRMKFDATAELWVALRALDSAKPGEGSK